MPSTLPALHHEFVEKCWPRGSIVEPATALLVTVFNLGIASGTLIGMTNVDSVGLEANMRFAGISVFLALCLVTRMLAVRASS